MSREGLNVSSSLMIYMVKNGLTMLSLAVWSAMPMSKTSDLYSLSQVASNLVDQQYSFISRIAYGISFGILAYKLGESVIEAVGEIKAGYASKSLEDKIK